MRSRLTWLFIGGGGAMVFLGIGVDALVTGDSTTFIYASVFFVLCIAIVATAFRAGHVWLKSDVLIYKAVFRNRNFRRDELSEARIETRTRFPSPRNFNMPVLVTRGGLGIPLPELCSPMESSIPVLDAMVELNGGSDRYMESLLGLAAWIQAWLQSEDWIEALDPSD